MALASDRGAEFTSRALALHVLSGMNASEGRWQRTLSRFNAGALKAVADKLDLPPIITWMMVAGRHTRGLAAMLPLVLEATDNATDIQIMEIAVGDARTFAEKPLFGVPSCSADQYTRVGKAAIAEFTRTIKQKHPQFFDSTPDARGHSRLLGMAIFHFEGSKLDRWIENRALAQYREQIERAELQALGLPDPETHEQLYRILETESRLLWKIRKSYLSTAYGTGQESR